MSVIGTFFGYVRDTPDARDQRFNLAYPGGPTAVPPRSVDLHAGLPAVRHQGNLGSCTAMAGAAMMASLYPGFEASPLALYYEARVLEGTTGRDAGCQIRSAMKALKKTGAIGEWAWPYDEFERSGPPPVDVPHRTIAAYSRLESRTDMLCSLALGLPFVMAITLPATFALDAGITGVMPLPVGEVETIGAHAMLAVGYDLAFRSNPDVIAAGIDPATVDYQAVLVRNSWGSGWGLPSRPGHAWIPMSWASGWSTGGDCWVGHKIVTTADAPQGPTVAGVPISGQFTS